MEASKVNPVYTVIAVDKSGTKYKLTNVTTDLQLSENDGELAQKCTVSFINETKIGSKYLSDIVVPGIKLYIYADTGNGKQEVFRGIIWEKTYESTVEKKASYTAYDHLIYLQNSKGCEYFKSGKSTKSIVSAICKEWGLKLKYEYDTITHPKLPLNNMAISDMFIEVLEAVRKKKGKRYVIRSSKDVIYVKKCGSNSDIYTFKSKKGAISTKSNLTMDGMVTKVIITGKEDKNDRVPIEATVKGSNISKYGTLQEIVNKDEGTTLAQAKSEAKQILKEKGKLTETHSIETPDIPWVKKGDLIKISAGDLKGSYYVNSITHDCLYKTMSMEVQPK